MNSLLIYGEAKGSGGYIRYLRGLLTEPALTDAFKVYFVASPQLLEAVGPIRTEVTVIRNTWIESSNRWQRALWHLIIYPITARRVGATLEFYPAGRLRTQLRRARTVTTCHNLLPFDSAEIGRIRDPNERAYLERVRRTQSQSMSRADGVVFLSDHSLEQVSRQVQLSGRRTVIAHGVDATFASPDTRDYSLGKRRNVLYVSPIFTYKNHLAVIEAVAGLRLRQGGEWHLHLVGGGHGTEAMELRHFVEERGYDDFVTFYDFVESDRELSTFYANADIFVFASSCETFGITLLEAMIAALPIACARRSGLNDLALDSVLYFDPAETSTLEATLIRLESDEHLRRELGRRAHRRAREFTWQRCAQQHATFMRGMADRLCT